MLYELFILASYAFIGAGIKYIDQAYDLEVFSKKKANAVAVLTAALMGGLMVFDAPSTVIFFAILLVVAITKKIDNIAFYTGTGVLILLPFLAGFLGLGGQDALIVGWLPFTALVFSGVADEVGNDWADERRKKRYNSSRNGLDDTPTKRFAETLFTYRFAMKLAILIIAVTGFVPYLYLLAFILFDALYVFVDWYSFKIKASSLAPADVKALAPISLPVRVPD